MCERVLCVRGCCVCEGVVCAGHFFKCMYVSLQVGFGEILISVRWTEATTPSTGGESTPSLSLRTLYSRQGPQQSIARFLGVLLSSQLLHWVCDLMQLWRYVHMHACTHTRTST